VSGFFGMLRLDQRPIQNRLLDKIAAEMSFRGPHGANTWNHGRLGSCFALMRTGPVKQAPQQPVCWNNRFWLWGDIRLDAREELVEELSSEDYSAAIDVTSEELLLRAWAKWGSGSLERVIGDFSFALWDEKEETLWCARDFVGARPFFYAHVRGAFCFSNTLQILPLVPEVSTELDESFLGDYLLDGWSADEASTVYKDIRRLPAGRLLRFSKGALEVRRFRKLPIEEPLKLSRPEAYLEAYRELLEVAVRDRLPEGPTALYLSGGLDSGSVCAAASQIAADRGQKEKLKAFTIGWNPFFDDPEPGLATLTALHLGLTHEVVEEIESRPYQGADSRLECTPEPNDEIFFARDQRNSERIAAHATVVISGDGGDDVLIGQSWAYFTYLWEKKEWLGIAADFGGYLWSQRSIPPLHGGFRTKFLKFLKGENPYTGYPEWINPEFEARTNLKQKWVARKSRHRKTEHPLHPRAYETLHDGYWATVLEMEDAGWNRVCLESRAPLLDLRMLMFLLRLPPVPWCANKYLSRQAMKNLLPNEIVNRPKTPLLGSPLESYGEPADWLAALPKSSLGRVEEFVNWPKWCETLCRSKGSLTWGILRPAGLFHWLKAVESEKWIQYSESRGA
jgi:asparagine synthase (glutamine-hydrolysing)